MVVINFLSFSLAIMNKLIFKLKKKIAMYKEYASPNFIFWLLTKFMQLHTNLQLQRGEKNNIDKFKWGVESQFLKQSNYSLQHKLFAKKQMQNHPNLPQPKLYQKLSAT
jgi:hypothetical protein